jgi:hypothetical protein
MVALTLTVLLAVGRPFNAPEPVTAIELQHVRGSEEASLYLPEQSKAAFPIGDYSVTLKRDGSLTFTGVRNRKAGKYAARLSRKFFDSIESKCDSPLLDGDLHPDYSNPNNPPPNYRRFYFSNEMFGDDTVKVYRGGQVQELSNKGARSIGFLVARCLRHATDWKIVDVSAM